MTHPYLSMQSRMTEHLFHVITLMFRAEHIMSFQRPDVRILIDQCIFIIQDRISCVTEYVGISYSLDEMNRLFLFRGRNKDIHVGTHTRSIWYSIDVVNIRIAYWVCVGSSHQLIFFETNSLKCINVFLSWGRSASYCALSYAID